MCWKVGKLISPLNANHFHQNLRALFNHRTKFPDKLQLNATSIQRALDIVQSLKSIHWLIKFTFAASLAHQTPVRARQSVPQPVKLLLLHFYPARKRKSCRSTEEINLKYIANGVFQGKQYADFRPTNSPRTTKSSPVQSPQSPLRGMAKRGVQGW